MERRRRDGGGAVLRERDPEARRERLLEAAGGVFAETGYGGGSVRAIARVARVNVASVNYYFGSKEGLYREVLLRAHRQVMEAEPEPEVGGDAREALRGWVGYCLRFVLLRRASHPVLGRLMAHEMRQPTVALSELVTLVIRPKFEQLAVVVAAVAGGGMGREASELAAHQIVGMCVHFDHSREVVERLGYRVPGGEVEIAELAESVAEMALGGLAGMVRSGKGRTKRIFK